MEKVLEDGRQYEQTNTYVNRIASLSLPSVAKSGLQGQREKSSARVALIPGVSNPSTPPGHMTAVTPDDSREARLRKHSGCTPPQPPHN